MALRAALCRSVRGLRSLAQHTRCRSTQAASANQLHVTVNETTGIAMLEMCKKPVNSLNLEMLTELTITLDKLESNPHCNGVIMSSVVPKVFSAGLDIQEMYQPDRARLTTFWRALQTFWMRFYVSPLATVAAINGHCPAGGCLLALSCDYRIMSVGMHKIGLNETKLGIIAPFWFMECMRNVIGQRQAEKALQLGLQFSPETAVHIGLVDEIVEESELMDIAQQELSNWLKVPKHARQLTKEALRRPSVEKLERRQDEEIEYIVNFLTKDSIQQALGQYLESLKKATR